MAGRRDRIKVLLAESEPDRCSEMSDVLAADGRFGTVRRVSDGDGAVALAEQVDVVVVDLSVAGLGCLGAISHIRGCRCRPAVVGTSRPGQEWLDPVVRAEGAADVVMWPDDRAHFCDRVAEAVGMGTDSSDRPQG